VNCDYALRIGTALNGNDQEPTNLTVANNVMYNTSINAYQITTQPSDEFISEGNIPDLEINDMVDDGNFHRLTNTSAPIAAGLGNYSFLTLDILGANRKSSFDAGAEEFGSNGPFLPFDSADVGVKIGFGAYSENTTSLNYTLKELGVTIFPIPASQGTLNILSKSIPLKHIEIFDLEAKSLISSDGKERYSHQMDITDLHTGIYFIRLEGIGQTKLIIE